MNNLSELELKLIEKSKNQSPYLVDKLISWQLYHKTMFIFGFVTIISVLLSILVSLKFYKTNSDFQIVLITYLLTLTAYMITYTCYVGSRKGPIELKLLDKWKWVKGRKLVICQFICFILFLIICLVASVYKEKIIYSVFIYFVLGLIFYGTVLYILKKPSQITNGLVTGFGSMILLWAILIPLVYFIEVKKISIYLILSLFLALLMLLKAIYQIREKDFINPVQFMVLKIIEPERLIESFKSSSEKIKDKIEALNILKNLDDRNEFGVKKALAEELTKENTSFMMLIYGLVLSGILFAIAAIGEGFWQDLLYDPYIKPLLCKYLDVFCAK